MMSKKTIENLPGLSAVDQVRIFVGERSVRKFLMPVSSRLGVPGLAKIVEAILKERPQQDMVYMFKITNKPILRLLKSKSGTFYLHELRALDELEIDRLYYELGI
ncbi:hypothetical protein [Pedobacter paludis]|uniref:Uncharacterized protein n=1 Tax=Pedobacter paludis TaxID=2203212 RepID=A0A317F2X5_9SPHI|nr:hypothetical protein [Pedobacter paludis]PWS32643.1 hypothetical protein DF947_06100 [Pedobacter paludis]